MQYCYHIGQIYVAITSTDITSNTKSILDVKKGMCKAMNVFEIVYLKVLIVNVHRITLYVYIKYYYIYLLTYNIILVKKSLKGLCISRNYSLKTNHYKPTNRKLRTSEHII